MTRDPAADPAPQALPPLPLPPLPLPVLVCLRCFNGIPAEWVTRWTGPRHHDGAIGQAFCWVCYGQVRVGEAAAL
jgi:hypothetical protein